VFNHPAENICFEIVGLFGVFGFMAVIVISEGALKFCCRQTAHDPHVLIQFYKISSDIQVNSSNFTKTDNWGRASYHL